MTAFSRPALLRRLRLALTSGATCAILLAVPTHAQDTAAPAPQEIDPAAVVATVDGEIITEADLSYAAEDLAQELRNVPASQQRAFLTSVLIDMKVVAKAAREKNMQDTETFARRLDYLEDRALRRAYFSEEILPQVTDEQVAAKYEELMADFEAQEEIRARHILVPDQADAEAIKAEIDGGKPFEDAARENSIDGSAGNGGDLGYFRRGQMVPPFEQAAFALEPGQVSAPVQSQFGWHIIKLEDKRQSSPPPLDQVRPQVRQQLIVETFGQTVDALKQGATIEIDDPNLAAAIDLQGQGSAQ